MGEGGLPSLSPPLTFTRSSAAMNTTASRYAVLLPLALVAACAGASTDSMGALTRDSAGVQITESTEPRVEGWSAVGPPLMVIEPNGESSDPLLQVKEARALGEHVIVLNGKPPQVLLFDTDGQFVRAIGRTGGGPGEYRSPIAMEVSQEGITTWDVTFGPRITFDPNGGVRSSRSYDLAVLDEILGDSLTSEHHFPIGQRGIILAALRVGGRSVADLPDGPFRAPGNLVMVNEDMSVRRLGEYKGILAFRTLVGGRPTFVPPMLTVATKVAVDPGRDRVLVGFGDRQEIHVWDSTGALRQSIRWSAPLEIASDSVFRRMRELWRSQVRAMLRGGDPDDVLDELPDQRQFPPVLDLVVAANGELWVRTGFEMWYVFDVDGTWLTKVKVPLRNVYEVDTNWILGLSVDGDGVERVVKLPLTRAEPVRGGL